MCALAASGASLLWVDERAGPRLTHKVAKQLAWAVRESVTNAASSTPRQEVIRIDLLLINTKSGWKVNRVNILQQPGQSTPLGGG